MKGILFSHNGACSVAAGAHIEGKMLSTGGGIGFSTGVLYNDPLCFDGGNPNSISLPIDLLNFSTTVKGLTIQLDWVTTAEINNDNFTTERSIDGVDFNSITNVNGAGNSTQRLSYSTVDDRPVNGLAYYRLKQTDYNGQTSYSNIITERFDKLNDFNLTIYPNPFSTKTVFHTTEYFNNSKLIVSNSYGQIVKEVSNNSGQMFTLHCNDL